MDSTWLGFACVDSVSAKVSKREEQIHLCADEYVKSQVPRGCSSLKEIRLINVFKILVYFLYLKNGEGAQRGDEYL